MDGPFVSSYALLWFLVIAEAWALIALYHHFGRIYLSSRQGREAQGPAEGQLVKHFVLSDMSGASVSTVSGGKPTFLVFVSTTCEPCAKLMPELCTFLSGVPPLNVILLARGKQDDVAAWLSQFRLPADLHVVVDKGGQLGTEFNVGLTPYCIGIDMEGRAQVKGIFNDAVALQAVTERLWPASRSPRAGSGAPEEVRA